MVAVCAVSLKHPRDRLRRIDRQRILLHSGRMYPGTIVLPLPSPGIAVRKDGGLLRLPMLQKKSSSPRRPLGARSLNSGYHQGQPLRLTRDSSTSSRRRTRSDDTGRKMNYPNDPETAVQRQLDAFNSRDVDALLSFYAEDAQLTGK